MVITQKLLSLPTDFLSFPIDAIASIVLDLSGTILSLKREAKAVRGQNS